MKMALFSGEGQNGVLPPFYHKRVWPAHDQLHSHHDSFVPCSLQLVTIIQSLGAMQLHVCNETVN